jgi:L-amino acid N-acyltransferase YncA
MLRAMPIRDATPQDCPAIWPFLHRIVAAGETFSRDRDVGEERARAMWMHEPPGRTVVAVESDGTVLGTAETQPNHGGPRRARRAHRQRGLHGADHAGRGVGRALGQHVIAQARADGYRAMQFNAVAETNQPGATSACTSCTAACNPSGCRALFSWRSPIIEVM